MNTKLYPLTKVALLLTVSIFLANCGVAPTGQTLQVATGSTSTGNTSNSSTNIQSALTSLTSQLTSTYPSGLSSTIQSNLTILNNYTSYSSTQIQAALTAMNTEANNTSIQQALSNLAYYFTSANVAGGSYSVSSGSGSTNPSNSYPVVSQNFTVTGASPNFTINTTGSTSNNSSASPKWISTASSLSVGVKMTTPTLAATIPGTGYQFPFRCLSLNISVLRQIAVGSDSFNVSNTYTTVVSNTGSTITNTQDPCYIANNNRTVYTQPVLNLSSEIFKNGSNVSIQVTAQGSDNCRIYGYLNYVGCPVNPIYSTHQFAGTVSVAYDGTQTISQY